MGSSQQIRVQWRSHQATVLSLFEELYNSQSLVDVTLAAEGQYLRAHKAILSTCSPYFQELFSIEHGDKSTILFLKDVKFTELQNIITFIYRGEINIQQNDLKDFLKVAESLKIRGLSESSGPSTTMTSAGGASVATPLVNNNTSDVGISKINIKPVPGSTPIIVSTASVPPPTRVEKPCTSASLLSNVSTNVPHHPLQPFNISLPSTSSNNYPHFDMSLDQPTSAKRVRMNHSEPRSQFLGESQISHGQPGAGNGAGRKRAVPSSTITSAEAASSAAAGGDGGEGGDQNPFPDNLDDSYNPNLANVGVEIKLEEEDVSPLFLDENNEEEDMDNSNFEQNEQRDGLSFELVKKRGKNPNLIVGGFTYSFRQTSVHDPNTSYWRCNKYRGAGSCKARVVKSVDQIQTCGDASYKVDGEESLNDEDSSAMLQGALDPREIRYVTGSRGSRILFLRGFTYHFNGKFKDVEFWGCRQKLRSSCKCRLIYNKSKGIIYFSKKSEFHNHQPDPIGI